MIYLLLIICILLASVLAFFVIWQIRTRNFKPTADKRLQQSRLNADLKPTGFGYQLQGDYFYALMDCWQREAGYCKLYDEGSPLFNMVMDCEPVAFYYGGKRWLIELWKGQYGITTGAEIGVYNTARPDLHTEKVNGTFFEPIQDHERLWISFVLRKNGAVLLKRKALHWWLSAFRLGEFTQPSALTMDAKIRFPNKDMCAAFLESLQKIGYRRQEYSVFRTTVRIHYTKPHSPQPILSGSVQADAVQAVNENNCKLLSMATAAYPDTLDKLEYLKTAMPELYHFCFDSLYAKSFFGAFELIREALREQGDSPDSPQPPCECPKDPCCRPRC